MAYQFDVNNAGGANGGAEAVFLLKELLKSAGWVVRSSGDGTTFFAASDGITTAGAGAGGMNNSRAWFCIRQPPSAVPRREFCCQRGSSGEAFWWITMSAEDGFTLTAGDADDKPTATDDENLFGTTTVGTTLFAAAASYRIHIGADNAAPFAFWFFCVTNGTGANPTAIVFEPLAAGSFNSVDADPAVYYVEAASATTLVSTSLAATGGPVGWFNKNTVGPGGPELFVDMPALEYRRSGGTIAPNGAGSNPYDGDDNHFPIPYGRDTSTASSLGWKGFGSQMRWKGTVRANMSTLSDGGTRTKVIVGDVVLPWDGSVPVV